ncbi:hypothetical protein DER46DRAFT_641859 [Fusarium sp. MPI-SDFR-AT-0072]|nr:hypothetical protein DER46DRAFT_641859 [Fusarium sp. MPI-SDFR-AT-0072]
MFSTIDLEEGRPDRRLRKDQDEETMEATAVMGMFISNNLAKLKGLTTEEKPKLSASSKVIAAVADTGIHMIENLVGQSCPLFDKHGGCLQVARTYFGIKATQKGYSSQEIDERWNGSHADEKYMFSSGFINQRCLDQKLSRLTQPRKRIDQVKHPLDLFLRHQRPPIETLLSSAQRFLSRTPNVRQEGVVSRYTSHQTWPGYARTICRLGPPEALSPQVFAAFSHS